VRLRADAALGDLGLTPELERRIALHEEKLALYREIEQRDFAAAPDLTRAARIHHMILKKGILYEENSIAWARDMLLLLQEK
jgi:hypothetical protein